MTEYRVTWKEYWNKEERTFNNYEEAVEWAKMKKTMLYKEVKLEKLEVTEMEF